MAFFNTASNADIIVGTSLISVVRISYRFAAATTQTNTFSGRQTLLGNSATNAPFQFQTASALVTNPVAHYVEWDNATMYTTALFSATGTWTAGVNPTVTLSTGTTAGLLVGGTISSGITPNTLTVGSVLTSTTFTLVGTATNTAATATAFTAAGIRDNVLTQNSFGTY